MSVRRGVIGITLIVLLLMMGIHYDAVAAQHDPYPSHAELQQNYTAHVGEQIYFWGRIIERTPDKLLVESEEIELTVDVAPDDADVGDAIQIYGTLKPGHGVASNRLIASDDSNLIYLYGISGFATILTVSYFFRFWTIDWREVVVVKRGRN